MLQKIWVGLLFVDAAQQYKTLSVQCCPLYEIITKMLHSYLLLDVMHSKMNKKSVKPTLL